MRTCAIEQNRANCNCTYDCERKGICCECVSHHRRAGQLPACYFTREAERTYDRSVANYLRTRG